YISIRQTQANFFNGRLTASSRDSGVSMPDFMKIAQAFDLPVVKIKTQQNLKAEIENVLSTKGPIVCEVMLNNNYIFSPKLSSEKLPDGTMISKPLEDMYPFLSCNELESNMISIKDKNHE
ncbi:MAG: thiamine pyrophosphate-dependent enzyme, partial [Candidatus Gastranaerophilales bacterium]|nr:thiamine pyrophosphate-dependent enzyme [Candidatus Gastranaerophilales bacterium]